MSALRVWAEEAAASGRCEGRLQSGLHRRWCRDPARLRGGDAPATFRDSRRIVEVADFLQWGDPFGAAVDDYDLYVFQANSDELVTQSTLVQNGNDDPIEAVEVICQNAARCVGDLQISLVAGAAQPLKMFCVGCALAEFNTPAGSIFGASRRSGGPGRRSRPSRRADRWSRSAVAAT